MSYVLFSKAIIDEFAWGQASPVMLCVSKWAWIDV
jgi:hypothetical protein